MGLREAASRAGRAASSMVIKSGDLEKPRKAGIMTGVLLAVARISGETAPLLFTALGNNQFMSHRYHPCADGFSLPVVIFQYRPVAL